MHILNSRHLLFVLTSCIALASGISATPAIAAGKPIRVAFGSTPSAMTLSAVYGPITYGTQYGLTVTKDNYTVFSSGALSVQAVLAGEADVDFVSFMSLLLLRQSGQDFKLFCPTNAQIDHVLVGRNGVTTVAQLNDPKTRVAISAPSNSATTLINAMLITGSAGFTVKDFTNTKLIDNVDTRQTAWVANEVDVATMRLSQFRQSQKDVPDGVIILKSYEVLPVYIFAALIAPTAWLYQNRDTAAGLCAANLKAIVEMTKSFDAYDTAVKAVIDKPPADDILKESYDLITQYGFWAPSKTMNSDAVNFMSKIAITSGIMKQAPDPNDVLDMKTYNMALGLLSDDDRSALVKMAVTGTAAAPLGATPSAVATIAP